VALSKNCFADCRDDLGSDVNKGYQKNNKAFEEPDKKIKRLKGDLIHFGGWFPIPKSIGGTIRFSRSEKEFILFKRNYCLIFMFYYLSDSSRQVRKSNNGNWFSFVLEMQNVFLSNSRHSDIY
jgi:hypothetical protein